MEANGAPEKIFVNPNSSAITNCTKRFMFIHDNTFDESKCTIEYTRTDTFMKKSENFLEMLGYGFTITDNITHANYDKEQLIEDFSKYMKGE